MRLGNIFQRTTHEHNGQLDWLPAPIAHALGSRRRTLGLYDSTTKDLLGARSHHPATLRDLLRELSFQRDLGISPSDRNCAQLLEHAPGRSNRSLMRFSNLLLEAQHGEQLLVRVDADRLRRISSFCPPVAALLSAKGKPLGEPAPGLARLHAMQEQWRREFLGLVSERDHSVCVVGNSSTLRGKRLGKWIDAHDVVVRFNCCSSSWLEPEDAGEKMNVWVRAPGFAPLHPPGGHAPPWVILSGADVRFQLKNWQSALSVLNAGAKVLTMPLDVWRELVEQLKAPPSAGVAVLRWLGDKRGSLEGLAAVGFEERELPQSSRFRPTRPSRHNWSEEAQLIRELRSAGLASG